MASELPLFIRPQAGHRVDSDPTRRDVRVMTGVFGRRFPRARNLSRWFGCAPNQRARFTYKGLPGSI